MTYIKQKIIESMKNLYNKKYITVYDGNLSFKPKNKNYFYITAGSVKKNELTEDQIIKVSFNDNIKSNNLIYDNKIYKTSRELNMHSYLLTDPMYYNKDIFVLHVHPPKIISYIGLNPQYSNQLSNIKNIFPEINVGKIGKNVKLYDAGTKELAEECYNNLISNDIVGIKNHGTLSIGKCVDDLTDTIDTLEYYIDIKLRSKC